MSYDDDDDDDKRINRCTSHTHGNQVNTFFLHGVTMSREVVKT